MAPFDSTQESTQLASRLNHDLGAPVRAIRGFGRFMKQRLEEGKQEEALEFAGLIELEAERLEGMLTGLISYLRVSPVPPGQSSPQTTPVDATACAQKALERVKSTTDTEISADIGPLPMISGPTADWERLFTEVFSNSLKFKSKTRPLAIQVRGESTSEGWRIEISDNGVGLPPGSGDRPFVLFSRLHDPEQFSGHGVGLALSARLAASHGARLFFLDRKDDWQSGATLVMQLEGRSFPNRGGA